MYILLVFCIDDAADAATTISFENQFEQKVNVAA